MSTGSISWRAIPDGSSNGSSNGSANGATVDTDAVEPGPEPGRMANGSGSAATGSNGASNGSGGLMNGRLRDADEPRHDPELRPEVRDPVRGPHGNAADKAPEPEFRRYLGVLRRRIGIVVLVPLLTVGVALGLALASTRIYESSADVRLTSASQQSVFSTDTGGPSDPARQIETEIEVIRSNPIARAVDRKLGSATSEVSSVEVGGVGATDLIRITVQSPSPTRARRAANLYASTYITARRAEAVDDLVAVGAVLEKKLLDIRAQITAATVTAERDALTAQYQLLKDKLDQVQVDASLGKGGARVVAPATTPLSPASPQPLRDASVALMLGLLLGISLVFLLDYLDDRTHTAEDVARYGDGLAVLAEVPAVTGWRNRKATRVVGLDEPTSVAAESYRSLRTSLQIIQLRHHLETVLVTSPLEGEGKTTTAVNLGVTMARAGRRVVLLDLDLRRPRLERFFGLDNPLGVTSVLIGEVPLLQAVHEVADGVPPLRVLGAGPVPSNPSEVLGSGQVGDLLASLQATADLVIIDAPPLLPVTDALVLSRRVDGVLLVVAADETRRRDLGRAIDSLQRAEAPVLGSVLNNVSHERRTGYGRKYSYGEARLPDVTGRAPIARSR